MRTDEWYVEVSASGRSMDGHMRWFRASQGLDGPPDTMPYMEETIADMTGSVRVMAAGAGYGVQRVLARFFCVTTFPSYEVRQ